MNAEAEVRADKRHEGDPEPEQEDQQRRPREVLGYSRRNPPALDMCVLDVIHGLRFPAARAPETSPSSCRKRPGSWLTRDDRVARVRNFRLVVDELDGVTSVALVGELDMAEVGALEAELARVEEQHPALLVLDLSELSLVDSHGLSALLDTETRARRDGRRLVLVPPPDQVMQVFRITLLDQRFEWHSSSELEPGDPVVDAVERLRRRVGSADV